MIAPSWHIHNFNGTLQLRYIYMYMYVHFLNFHVYVPTGMEGQRYKQGHAVKMS